MSDRVVDNVRIDAGAGLRLAVDHLLGAGRAALGLLNGPPDTSPGACRLAAFEHAVRARAVPAGSSAIECAGDFAYRSGLTAAARLLSRFRPDAVMRGNDLLAFAHIRKLASWASRYPAM